MPQLKITGYGVCIRLNLGNLTYENTMRMSDEFSELVKKYVDAQD